jgi:DNA-binding MarR family transcriptional regulator
MSLVTRQAYRRARLSDIYKHCYISPVTIPDPAPAPRPSSLDELPNFWRDFTALRARMNDDLTALYGELGIRVNPRFSMAIMFLADGDASIRSLAQRCNVTHSAMSQSVTAMRAARLVTTQPGTDARERIVSLTEDGRRLAPLLWAEWDATEAAAAELDAELEASLAAFVQGATAALDRESFAARVRRHLQAPA